MFNIGGGEVLVILLIALIVLGPDKLPNAARQAGKYLGDFRRMSHGFQRELRDAMDLGDLGDLMSGTSKPQSAGGPTAQPATPTVTPSTDAAPIESTVVATEPASANGSRSPSADGDAPATGAAASGADTPVVRKRSIEVDGPSASFD